MRYSVRRSTEERFWPKVEKTDGCWLWKGGKVTSGYGAFYFSYRPGMAHRYSWILHFGAIPLDYDGKTLYVLHRCDTRACVNPNHLFLGTARDNMHDALDKGRFIRAGHGRLRLTENCVRQIREQFRSGQGARKLAREYGVCPATIWNIVSRRTWKRVKEIA